MLSLGQHVVVLRISTTWQKEESGEDIRERNTDLIKRHREITKFHWGPKWTS